VVVNKILDDFVKVVHPRRCTLTGRFTPRGGISSTIVAEHTAGK